MTKITRIVDRRVTWPTTVWRGAMLVAVLKIIDLLMDIKVEVLLR